MKTCDIQIRDPFILPVDGQYYLFGSTDPDIWKSDGIGFDVYVGRDLEEWTGPLPAFRPPEGFWGIKNFWAPEVYSHEGAYFMFASFIGEGYNRGTAILHSERPEGPYRPWSNGAVTPKDWMCLDGTLYIEDGEPWIVFCHEWVQVQDGTICSAKLDRNLSNIVTNPKILFSSSQSSWSAKAYSPSNKIEGFVTDGCFLHKLKSGKLLLLWSCVGADGYCIGYAISDSGKLAGPWRQSEQPLFAKDGGHGMIFRTYDDRLLLTIHTPNQSPHERAVFFELEEREDGIRIADSAKALR